MHVHVCCWARGGPGWSVDFWCEYFALLSACRFSDVSLLYLGWPNFLHVYKEEKHVRCRKHASQSLVAVGKGFASKCLDSVAFYHLLVTPNYGLMLSARILGCILQASGHCSGGRSCCRAFRALLRSCPVAWNAVACWQSRELIPNYNKYRSLENCCQFSKYEFTLF